MQKESTTQYFESPIALTSARPHCRTMLATDPIRIDMQSIDRAYSPDTQSAIDTIITKLKA